MCCPAYMERPHSLLGQDKGERLTALNFLPIDHLVRVIITHGFDEGHFVIAVTVAVKQGDVQVLRLQGRQQQAQT